MVSTWLVLIWYSGCRCCSSIVSDGEHNFDDDFMSGRAYDATMAGHKDFNRQKKISWT